MQVIRSSLICFALPGEAAPFRAFAQKQPNWRVEVTGMGMANAERAIGQVLARSRPGQVLTCGLAGGLNPELKLSQVVYDADDEFIGTTAFEAAGATPARFYSSPKVIVMASAKQDIRRVTGADAVEMESKVIRTVCRQNRIPSATVRVISDAANEDLPLDFNSFLTAQFKMNHVKLAGALFRSPGLVIRLIRFNRQTQRAAAQLAQVLARGLEQSSG